MAGEWDAQRKRRRPDPATRRHGDRKPLGLVRLDYFALVAGLSVATKYIVRYRGAHLFNPSNVGLVVAFLVMGSSVVDPLDFWWAPLDPWMALAYVIILGGGIAITRHLRLLEMAAMFWVILSAGLGALVASGHCMSATWSLDPVCGSRFWWVLVTSPEILIFLLFMITDPKTIPTGRKARVVFAAVLGLVATVLIALHALEFGAKVGLLGSLMVLNPIRGLFEHLFPAVTSKETDRPGNPFLKASGMAVVLLVVAVAIVAAGTPAREPAPTPTLPGTHATLLLLAGVAPHVVSMRLGHRSVAFTLQQYAHVLPQQQADAVRKLAAALSGDK